LAVLVLLGCGGGASSPSFSVAPEPRTVLVGDQLALSALANVDLAGDLEWEVQETYGGGLRNSQGDSTVYFAPEAAGIYHLILRAARADGQKLKQTVDIRVLPIVTLEPTTTQVAPGGTVTFTVTMKGLGRNAVKWSVDEPGGGEIAEDGLYQAPAKGGTYHVTATAAADPQVSVQATVVVS
jgi:plastocyanin